MLHVLNSDPDTGDDSLLSPLCLPVVEQSKREQVIDSLACQIRTVDVNKSYATVAGLSTHSWAFNL